MSSEVEQDTDVCTSRNQKCLQDALAVKIVECHARQQTTFCFFVV